MRQKAEEELKCVNYAYSILKDPHNDARSTPPELRVTPKQVCFSNVISGQNKTATIKVESIGGPYTKFWMADSPAPWMKVVEVKSLTADPLPLEVTIEASAGSSMHRHSDCDLPIRIENETTGARSEVSVRIQLEKNMKAPGSRKRFRWGMKTEGFASSLSSRILLSLLILAVAGLLASAYAQSLIPFWLIMSFSVLFLIEKWFGNPERKHKALGIFYRIGLNLVIFPYLGFAIWSGFRLFSGHFLRTPLIGSVVFLFECVSLLWLWQTHRKNSWRWPGMKLTFGFLIAALIVFSFAGVQPFDTYKDRGFARIHSFFQ